MIKLSAKGLAKYMTSGAATQRAILRNYKHPDPEGAVQTKYYAEARAAIEEYHSSGNDPATAVRAVDALHDKLLRTQGRKRDRIRNNIRAVESYLGHFGKKNLTVLPSPDLKYAHGEVLVSAYPDLYVKDGNQHKTIKLDFSKQNVNPHLITIVLQVTLAAAQARKLPVKPQNIIYLDVVRGQEHRGAKTRARLMRDVDAACQTIEDVWPRL